MAKQFEVIALNIAIPIVLRKRNLAPERCVRNLMELGERIKNHSQEEEKEEIYQTFLQLCKEGTQSEIIDYFLHIYTSGLC